MRRQVNQFLKFPPGSRRPASVRTFDHLKFFRLRSNLQSGHIFRRFHVTFRRVNSYRNDGRKYHSIHVGVHSNADRKFLLHAVPVQIVIIYIHEDSHVNGYRVDIYIYYIRISFITQINYVIDCYEDDTHTHSSFSKR